MNGFNSMESFVSFEIYAITAKWEKSGTLDFQPQILQFLSHKKPVQFYYQPNTPC